MGENNSINCEKCGKSIHLEQGMTKGFCLYCGEQFNVEQPEQKENIALNAKKLYESRAWPQLWQLVKNERDSGKIKIYKIISGLYKNYQKYADESAELEKKTRKKALFEAFMGRNSYASDEIHNEFRAFVENCVRDLAEAQKEREIAESIGPGACVLLTEFLLAKKDSDSVIFWPLVACEHLCIPIIQFIPLQNLVEIYNEYNIVNPQSQTLPNQKNVKMALAEAIVNKGGEVPKKRKFGKKQ